MMASYPAHNKAILLLAVSVEYAQKSSNTVSFFIQRSAKNLLSLFKEFLNTFNQRTLLIHHYHLLLSFL